MILGKPMEERGLIVSRQSGMKAAPLIGMRGLRTVLPAAAVLEG